MKPIEKMTYKELLQLEAKVANAKEKAKAAEKAKLVARIDKVTQQHGFKLQELFNQPKATPVSHRPKPRRNFKKVFHPEDRTKFWTGYGPKPKWLKELEAS